MSINTTPILVEENREHFITNTEHLDTKVLVTCKCGAVWSEPVNVTPDEMLDTMAAHKVYFVKPKTVTL